MKPCSRPVNAPLHTADAQIENAGTFRLGKAFDGAKREGPAKGFRHAGKGTGEFFPLGAPLGGLAGVQPRGDQAFIEMHAPWNNR